MAAAPRQLLLIPGLLCDARLWADQMDALSDPHCSVRVADHGAASSMSGIGERILASAPPRFAVAGLSMGGYIALELLRQAPARITGLALINTSARADTPERIARRRAYMDLATRGRFRGISAAMLPTLVHSDRLTDTPLLATIREMAAATGAEAFLRQEQAIIDRPDSRPHLPSITCPTLVVGGSDDQMTPPALARELAAGIRGARLEIIDRCGHLAPLEQPARVTQLLREWLATLPA